MKYTQLFGWGVVIYSLMYLAWSGMALYGIAGPVARILQLIILVFVIMAAGQSLRRSSWKDVIPYSLTWVLLIALLDAIYAVPPGGWVIYTDWNLWVGYALVLLLPLLSPYVRARQSEVRDIT